uniref:Uncharacterized protein n=2 Tax=Glycine max TaxID=3847 RepID=K7K6D6_SOYBN|eukprot:XP_006574645.2 GPI ethanolamine phosphate transferase 2 isoform X1 [Glycine max]
MTILLHRLGGKWLCMVICFNGLFPGLFEGHDGVSSFFVKDTVQVDQNASRDIGYELSRDDWNFLAWIMLDILVGATGIIIIGSLYTCNFILFSKLNLDIYCFNVLMAPKLFEMDEVVKMIHINTLQNLENDQGKTLLAFLDFNMTMIIWAEYEEKYFISVLFCVG